MVTDDPSPAKSPVRAARLLLAVGTAGTAYAGDGHVFRPRQAPYGISHESWQETYWNWLLGPPDVATDCTKPQPHHKVVFLPAARFPAGEVEFSCTVPTGAALGVLLFGVAYSEGDPLYEAVLATLGDPLGVLEINIADVRNLSR